jgi:hypothetical protein
MGADAPKGGRLSARIQYAYLRPQTWLYRRNYPRDLQLVLGQAYKQSLKTGDARVAKARAAEVNAKDEENIARAKPGGVMETPEPVRVVAPAFTPDHHRGKGLGGGTSQTVPEPPVERTAARRLQVSPLLGRAVRLIVRDATDRCGVTGRFPRAYCGALSAGRSVLTR